MKKLTQDEFIEKAITIHGNKYDYSLCNYVRSREKVIIICPIHGQFKQVPASHLSGVGCKQCGLETIIKKKTHTKEIFIEKAIKIHGNLYDYSKVNYIKADEKVTIICKKHNEFSQTPSAHITGNGCPECGYSFNNNRKMDWIRRTGKKKKPGIFYVIRCYNNEEEFYKLGITSNTVKFRYREDVAMPYNYEIIKEVTSSKLFFIWTLEEYNKEKIKDTLYKPRKPFPGSSYECFKQLDLIEYDLRNHPLYRYQYLLEELSKKPDPPELVKLISGLRRAEKQKIA